MTDKQARKIQILADRFKVKRDQCDVLEGCATLAPGWVSLAIPLGGDRWYSIGIEPDGSSHS